MSDRLDIINNFIDQGMKAVLERHPDELPHSVIFSDLVKRIEEESKRTGDDSKYLLDHIQNVVRNMCYILNKKFYEVLDESVFENYKNEDFDKARGYLGSLENLIKKLDDEDKCFLLYTALYHDIGKPNIKSRHGVEGAEIIKDSNSEDRKRFVKLGFNRSKIFFMSDLVRYHDYLAMVGTGEVSYLIFAEVLYPVSNISISNPKCADIFIDFLLLLNLADMAGSSMGKLTYEDFTVLMHDYTKIKQVRKEVINNNGEIGFEDYNNIIEKLQILSENHTSERLRRLLRSGLTNFIKLREKNIKDVHLYVPSIASGNDTSKVKPALWFSRNYGYDFNDIIPINSSLRGINIKPDFYTKFAYICKLDYFGSSLFPVGNG